MSPRFVPASVAELARLGLFASLSGEELGRLAEATERIDLAPGETVDAGAERVAVVLSGLARSAAGMARPGDTAAGAVAAVTPCAVVLVRREDLGDPT